MDLEELERQMHVTLVYEPYQVIEEITDALTEVSPEFLVKIANQVLTGDFVYEEKTGKIIK